MNNDMNNTTKNIQIPFGVPENAKHLYEGSWGDQLWVFKENNRTVQQFGFQLVDTHGNVSEPLFQKRDKLLGKNGFNFVLNLVCDYDKADLSNIRNMFMQVQHSLEAAQLMERCDFAQVYRDLCKYVEEHQKADIITLEKKDEFQYANIPTKVVFGEVVTSHDWGWKPMEVKHTLKRLGLLRVNKGRPYDFAKYDKDGNLYRVISMRYEKPEEGSKNVD